MLPHCGGSRSNWREYSFNDISLIAASNKMDHRVKIKPPKKKNLPNSSTGNASFDSTQPSSAKITNVSEVINRQQRIRIFTFTESSSLQLCQQFIKGPGVVSWTKPKSITFLFNILIVAFRDRERKRESLLQCPIDRPTTDQTARCPVAWIIGFTRHNLGGLVKHSCGIRVVYTRLQPRVKTPPQGFHQRFHRRAGGDGTFFLGTMQLDSSGVPSFIRRRKAGTDSRALSLSLSNQNAIVYTLSVLTQL